MTKMIILSKFVDDWTKTVASIVLTMFFIFELDRDIVKIIILSKFYDDWTKTVTPRVFRIFILDLTY